MESSGCGLRVVLRAVTSRGWILVGMAYRWRRTCRLKVRKSVGGANWGVLRCWCQRSWGIACGNSHPSESSSRIRDTFGDSRRARGLVVHEGEVQVCSTSRLRVLRRRWSTIRATLQRQLTSRLSGAAVAPRPVDIRWTLGWRASRPEGFVHRKLARRRLGSFLPRPKRGKGRGHRSFFAAGTEAAGRQ